MEHFTSVFNAFYDKVYLVAETYEFVLTLYLILIYLFCNRPSLPLDTRIEILKILVDSYKQVTTDKSVKGLDVEDYEPHLREYTAQDIVKSLWLGTVCRITMIFIIIIFIIYIIINASTDNRRRHE